MNVEPRQVELDELYAEVFGTAEPASSPPLPRVEQPAPAISCTALSDDQILEKAKRSRKSGQKFTALWAGQWDKHFRSQSEGDSSVVFTLAFYTKDASQIDRLFRTSGLMRPKWDEKHGAKTYGQATIDNALAEVKGQWSPKGQRPKQRGPSAPGNPELPEITTDDIQLNDLTSQAIDALQKANQPPSVFARGGHLCRVMLDENDLPRIERFDKVRMRGQLTRVANFFSAGTSGGDRAPIGVNPPVALAENLVTLGAWPFPPLLGIAHAPILRSDGTICTNPGYDRQSRLIYCPAAGLFVPAIPAHPTTDELRTAVQFLSRLIADFPFADQASYANVLAILFSVLMRPVIGGHIPLAVVNAPVQGTGKTLLITILVMIAIGAVAGESIPSRDNDDEWRKKITSILLSGVPFALLDNIPDNSTIDSPALAAALTSHEWSDRLLGKNENTRLPSNVIWVATGNNLRVAGDMPRRCYTVSLDANTERPWERTGFAIADIEQYVRERRGLLLTAAFTMIRAWYAAGCPKTKGPVIGSFQEWADTIGSMLAFAGIDGFLTNLSETQAVQDEDTQQWSAFFTAWWSLFGARAVSVDDVFHQLLPQGTAHDDAIPDALLVPRDRGEGSLRRSLGRNLSRLTGRIYCGRKLLDAGTDAHRKVRTWRLEPQERPASAGLITPQESNNPAANPAQGDEQ